jgi:chromosomal replication initiator protein
VSVRDIEGALMRVDAYRSIAPELCDEGGRTGLNLVRAALQIRESAPRPRKPVKVQAICSHVCAELGVALEEVYGRGRHARVVLARSMCAVLSRELTTMSFPEIARGMGRPGHSSVVTACKRMGAQIKADAPPERGADLPAPYSGLRLRAVFERLRDGIVGCSGGSAAGETGA